MRRIRPFPSKQALLLVVRDLGGLKGIPQRSLQPPGYFGLDVGVAHGGVWTSPGGGEPAGNRDAITI